MKCSGCEKCSRHERLTRAWLMGIGGGSFIAMLSASLWAGLIIAVPLSVWGYMARLPGDE